MAKQSGLHQIKGKVGEYSYYKQTGVAGGLIRSINQGLSARVKTGAEYANTRRNNQEFSAACNVAGLLGKMVVPKFRPMILPMSQAKMAKEILKVARENSQIWGQRVVTSSDTEKLCQILSSMSKRDYSEFVSVDVERNSASSATVYADYTAEQASLMASLGITNLTVTALQYDLQTGQWVAAGQIMTTGILNFVEGAHIMPNDPVTPGTAYTESESLSVETLIPNPNHYGHQIVVFVVLPAREINGTISVLQEYCSFVAVPLPAAA